MIETGRAERLLVEQNRLYGEHVRLKKEQDQLQEGQDRLHDDQASEGNIGIQRFDKHWSKNINWKVNSFKSYSIASPETVLHDRVVFSARSETE
jgi:hypothetical protein